LAQKAPCPTGEVGHGYPWQTPGLMRGDQYAWMILTVDGTGRPIRCALGDNNLPDPETRFRLCKAYTDDWRAPAASANDPDTRTIRRQTHDQLRAPDGGQEGAQGLAPRPSRRAPGMPPK
jgi:hypothetical protein